MSLPSPLIEPVSPWEAPAAVLFNPWKHHAGALLHRIGKIIRQGEPALAGLATELIVIGSKLMDLYTGRFSPAEIGRLILDQLGQQGRRDPEAFRDSVKGEGGYRMLDLEDGSRWVVRVADDGERYIHLHPGRWVPQTRRVRANVLKTAVMALAHAGIHGGDPLHRELVNLVRGHYLALSPVGRDLEGDQGVGEIIELLRADGYPR
jgi:hypothetical protein